MGGMGILGGEIKNIEHSTRNVERGNTQIRNTKCGVKLRTACSPDSESG